LICRFVVLVGLLTPTVAMAEIAGQATVIDGDTLDIRGTRIRLHGIDAPESGQSCQRDGISYRCGKQAAKALDTLVSWRPVRCQKRDTDRYGRAVAECFVGSTSINQHMVREGWAVAERQYSRDYIRAEEIARWGRRGIWAGTFQTPADWRRGQNSQQNDNTFVTGLKRVCDAIGLWICPR
jgi:endonuclease YncB( thermonuclease family)